MTAEGSRCLSSASRMSPQIDFSSFSTCHQTNKQNKDHQHLDHFPLKFTLKSLSASVWVQGKFHYLLMSARVSADCPDSAKNVRPLGLYVPTNMSILLCMQYTNCSCLCPLLDYICPKLTIFLWSASSFNI